MIFIKKLHRIKGLSAGHLYQLTVELNKKDIPHDCATNRKDSRKFDIICHDHDLTEVITLIAKIKSEA